MTTISTSLLAKIAAVLVAVVGFIGTYNLTIKPANQAFGAASGTDHTQLETFYGGLTQGRGIIASSTSVSATLSGVEFQNADILDYTVNVANKTLTLPASTTLMCASLTKGQNRVVYIRHASTTAANTLTIAGGTGFILKTAATSTGPVLYGATDGSPTAQITITRKANSDCNALMTVFN